jgi:hypothetical protein
MGLGLAILANSRPFEGLFLALPVIVALVLWTFWRREPARQSAIRVLPPLLLVIAVAVVSMLYYFSRTTGDPFRSPYLANVAQYNPVPYFPWESIRQTPSYHHPIMQDFYLGWWLGQYEFARQHPVILIVIKAHIFWFFFLGPLLVFPVFMLGIVLPYGTSWEDFSKDTRFLLVVFCSSLVGLLLPVFLNPHYAAPMICVIYALVLLAMKRIRNWRWREKPTGLALVRYTSVAAVALLLVCAVGSAFHLHIHNAPTPETWCSPWGQLVDRAAIQTQLENSPGKHLVIVRYAPQHSPMEGWVYNNADIDHSKVVWANDMSATENAELVTFFKDRHVWLIAPDANPAKLSPYPIEEESSVSLSRIAP